VSLGRFVNTNSGSSNLTFHYEVRYSEPINVFFWRDAGSRCLRFFCRYLPKYTASHFRRQYSSLLCFPSIGRKLVGRWRKNIKNHRNTTSKLAARTTMPQKLSLQLRLLEYSTSVNRPFHFQFHDIKLSGSEYISLNNLHSSWKPNQDPSVDYDITRWF